jgi:phosphoadenosine phosphosulfate reductase
MKDMNSPPIPAKAGIEAFGHPISGRGASGSPWVPASAGMSGDRAGMLESTLRHATPQRILRAALGAFGDRIALVSSFGSESAVLLHMASEIDPAIPVLFLDTGMQFGQTLDYRKQLVARLGLTDVRDLRPAFKDLAAIDPSGMLWKTDTDACCNLRKVVPLDTALEGFDAWITGRKRFQAITRASLPVVEEAGRLVKVNPLANWTKAELDTYVAEHDLPPHPLVAQGFPSIGCWPCTKPVEEGHDAREGRWAGSEKTECGIHTPTAAELNAPQAPFEAIGEGL